MKVLVIGAAGKTGLQCVQKAVEAGHEVVGFVHGDHEKQERSLAASGVSIFHGDAQNPSRLETAMEGCKGVIDALGGHNPMKDSGLEANSARVVVEVMKRVGARRLVAVSALGVGDSAAEAGFFYEHVLMPTFLRGAMKDKAQMERTVEASGLEFVLVRPGLLSEDGGTGRVRVVEPGQTAGRITREDLASFLVEQLTSLAHLGTAVVVENGG